MFEKASVWKGTAFFQVPVVCSEYGTNFLYRTFRSLSSRTDLYFKLKDIAQKLAKDLESKNLCGKTIGLKIKLTSFEVRTRAKTLPVSIYKQEDLEKYAGQVSLPAEVVTIEAVRTNSSSLPEALGEGIACKS
jgi:DNA polymerase kappa